MFYLKAGIYKQWNYIATRAAERQACMLSAMNIIVFLQRATSSTLLAFFFFTNRFVHLRDHLKYASSNDALSHLFSRVFFIAKRDVHVRDRLKLRQKHRFFHAVMAFPGSPCTGGPFLARGSGEGKPTYRKCGAGDPRRPTDNVRKIVAWYFRK